MPFHVVVKRNATIPDTLKLINKAVNVYEHSPFVERLTKQLNPTGSKYEFCKRLFDWVCNNVQYELDTPGDEKVWSPELTAKMGVGDCKKMTVLIASVLKCAGIEPVLKHVYYDRELHTHIYVIVPFPNLKNYLTVDPVNHKQWNKEVEHSRASLNFLNGTKMNLHMMGNVPSNNKFSVNWKGINEPISGVDDDLSELAGIGCAINGTKELVLAESMSGDFGILGLDDDEIISGVGRRAKRSKAEKKARRKERRQKAFGVFKKANLAPMRASFLLLVRSNIFKLANRMAKAWIHNPEALTKMWLQWGGDPKKLKATIKAGAWKSVSKDIQGIGAADVVPSVEQLEALETQGIGFPPAIAAAIAAATPIVLAVIKIIGKSKDDQDTGEESNAEIMTKAVSEGAQNYADSEAMEGIGYMHDADDVVSGSDYDYIDGMGKKRKKNKSARKAAKKQKRAEKKSARKAKKGKGGGSEDGEGFEDVQEEVKETAKKKLRINDNDIKMLSTLAEYGTNKVLKKQVTAADINNMEKDDSGTLDTPKIPPTREADDIAPSPLPVTKPVQQYGELSKEITSPTGSSFGLTAINNFYDLLHWFRGSLLILFAVSLFASTALTIIADTAVILSLAWFTRLHIFSFIKTKITWLKIGKQ